MSKYINLEKQLVRLYQLGIKDEEVIKQFLLTACTEDVQKVRHGRWVDIPFTARWICSNCDYISEFASFKYCPDCGARMDLEDEE